MKVFVSYSRKNQDVVNLLGDDLSDVGHDVWIDRELSGGQGWWNVILGEIRDCDVFLLVCTSASLESAACLAEMQYAAGMGKPVVPLRCADDVDMELSPEPLPFLQWVPFTNGDKEELKALLKSVNGSRPGPVPDELPEEPPVPMSYLVAFKHEIETGEELGKAEQLDLLYRLESKVGDVANQARLLLLVQKFRAREDLRAPLVPNVDRLLSLLSTAHPVDIEDSSAAIPTSTEFPSEATPISSQQGTAGLDDEVSREPEPGTESKPVPPPGSGPELMSWWDERETTFASTQPKWDVLDKKQREKIMESIWVRQLGRKIGFKYGSQTSGLNKQHFLELPVEWQTHVIGWKFSGAVTEEG